MYSLSVRLNTMVFFTIIVLGLVSIGNILTTFHLYHPDKSTTEFTIKSINKFIQSNKYHQEHFEFLFDLDADLSTFYNWNVKQLFIYLSVDFNQGENTPKTMNPENKYLTESIIWDKIVNRTEVHKYHIKETNKRIKYPLRDVYKNLKGQEVSINLWVEVMPIVGYIFRDKVSTFNYTIPNEYPHVGKKI